MGPVKQASLNTHYTNTHDRFFRSCFSHVAYARELCVEKLQKQESSLPTIGKEADLLFRGVLEDKNKTPVYILLEHKHQRDLKKTYEQMADYRAPVRHHELSKTPKERPVILNCIFYHGKEPWQKGGKQGLDSVMYDVGVASMDPVLLKFYVFDLGRLDLSLWPNKGALYSVLYALLKVPQLGDEVRKKGREFFRECLSHLDEKDAKQLGSGVAFYVANVYNLAYEEVWSMAKSSGAKDLSFFESLEKHMGNPWKEAGRKQGRAEGLEKGLEKGRAEVAVNMLKEGFSVSIIAKATGLSADEIEALKKV